MTDQRALHVSIYRPADLADCTNNGVTGLKRNAKNVFLLGIPDGNYKESELLDMMKRGEDIVILKIVRRIIAGEPYVHAQPYGDSRTYAAGGNFIYTSDSRFRAVCTYPISVHDYAIE